jgi:fatty-acyl-CoA synthase
MILTTADSIGVRQRDVILAVVPMFHINGWCLPFAAALAGATLVLPASRLDPASLLRLIASERVTVSAGVPTVWLGVLDALDRAPGAHDVSSVRALVIGGSAVPKALLRGYEERYGITVLQAWGMTETTSIATVCRTPPDLDDAPPEVQYTWRTKQGAPMPFVEVRARTDAGLAPWDGETMGELEVRGPAVASAYYQEPSTGDRFTDDHWFRTGDVVTITQGGCIELRDRSKDLIRSGGEWISSVAIENALMGHPAVAEAAVVAVPHPKWDERPLAVVVLKQGQQATEEELRAHLAPEFAKWWLPDNVEFIEEIPRTSTGKFLKSALRERFRSRYEVS